jgi:large subunit ribosomal protein L4
MQVPVHNISGEVVGQVELRDDIFAVPVNRSAMHQALVRQLANAHLGTHDTKTRSEVSGGGKKPWRQKGTGRARQGSTRAPHWRHGGVAFGPTPRAYTQDMPRKMRRLAMRSALSVKAADQQIVVVESFALEAPKTKTIVQFLNKVEVKRSALILLSERNETMERSARNLPNVKTMRAGYLNVRDLLGYETLVVPLAALEQIESFLAD